MNETPYPSWAQDEYRISTDPASIDIDGLHHFLSVESYWARNIPLEVVERQIRHSICFSLMHHQSMIGFARIISDRATVAYLGDVFILPAYRGKGLSKWLMQCVMSHPELTGLRRWMLLTGDAHGLYEQFGFKPLKAPERWMELHNPDVYKRPD